MFCYTLILFTFYQIMMCTQKLQRYRNNLLERTRFKEDDFMGFIDDSITLCISYDSLQNLNSKASTSLQNGFNLSVEFFIDDFLIIAREARPSEKPKIKKEKCKKLYPKHTCNISSRRIVNKGSIQEYIVFKELARKKFIHLPNDEGTNRNEFKWLDIPYKFYGVDDNLERYIESLKKNNNTELSLRINYVMLEDETRLCAVETSIVDFLNLFISNIKEYEKNEILELINTFNIHRNLPSLNTSKNELFDVMSVNDCLKFDFFFMITELEDRFFIRLNKIFKVFKRSRRKFMNFLFLDNNFLEERLKFVEIYETYFTNKLTLLDLYTITSDFNDITTIICVNDLINRFNIFQFNFLEKIKGFFKVNYDRYFHYDNNFFNNEKYTLKDKLKIWIYDLFKNETHLLLLLLIPEIKFLIDFIEKTERAEDLYKKLHIIISYIIFKFNFSLYFIRLEFQSNKNNKNFLITDSKLLNSLILEIRMALSFFGARRSFTEFEQICFTYKAFLSFIRLYYPEQLKFFIFDEYKELSNFKNLKNFIKIKHKYIDDLPTKKDKRCVSDFFFILKSLDENLFNERNQFFDQETKNNILEKMNLERNSEVNPFKHNEPLLIEEITRIFKKNLIE